MLAFRGDADGANAIYERWIETLRERGIASNNREWDRTLMEPLGEYARFLEQAGRAEQALAVRAEERAVLKKYKTPFVQ